MEEKEYVAGMILKNIHNGQDHIILNTVVAVLYLVINISRIKFGYIDDTYKGIVAVAQIILFTLILCDPGIFYCIYKFKIRMKESVTLRKWEYIIIRLVMKTSMFIFVFIIAILLYYISTCLQILGVIGARFVLVGVVALFLLGRTVLVFFIKKLEIIRNNHYRFLVRSCVTTIVVVLVLTSISYGMVITTVEQLKSFNEISEFIVSRTYPTNISFGGYIRSNYDIYMWSLLGIGACGEMAYIAKTILKSKGYEAYVAGFPGEDHMFAVVFVNGSWWVLDPGYPRCRSVSMAERVRQRMHEMGNISSIIVYLDDNEFIDLTRYYVPYDVYVFNITYNGHPVAGACIILRHLFDGKQGIEIPGKGCYYTNVSGIAVVYLGGSGYNKTNLGKSDPYFEVYVNGEPTGIRIRSMVTGKVHLISKDLAKLDKDN